MAPLDALDDSEGGFAPRSEPPRVAPAKPALEVEHQMRRARLKPVASLRQALGLDTGDGGPRRRWATVVLALVGAGGVLVWVVGVRHLPALHDINRLGQWIQAQGPLAPVVFVGGYVLAELLFVPALPLTLLAGFLFGPLWGTVYVSLASTLAATLAFMIARSALRQRIQHWIASKPRLGELDAAVAEHGWRILIITRLVPLFPFNIQNFAYGLTRIRLGTYVLLSWICMLPGTIAYTLAGGALGEATGHARRTVVYLALAGILLVALSLLPRWLKRRSRAARTLLRPP
jgi:uncharacterized membrane protein YdjX (TVP38/TMEM64 family)